jgi:hypothetical protein
MFPKIPRLERSARNYIDASEPHNMPPVVDEFRCAMNIAKTAEALTPRLRRMMFVISLVHSLQHQTDLNSFTVCSTFAIFP